MKGYVVLARFALSDRFIFLLPASGAGARTGIGELAQHLINQPATHIGHIQRVMDRALLGHPYVKPAIDMACWDLPGK